MIRPFLPLPGTAAVLLSLLPTLLHAEAPAAAPTPVAASTSAAADMALAAQNLLSTLDETQRAKAFFPLTSEERQNWHFVPLDRQGITLADLRPDQDHLVYGLLGSALSAEGWRKTTTIMSLEKVLFDLENGAAKRNTEKYYVAIFGEPKTGQPWGWRFEGHHISLNFTITADSTVALTPSFLGANPGEIKDGPRAGLRVLADEENFGLALARSLSPEQQKSGFLPGYPPAELLTNQEPRVQPLSPAGVSASTFSEAQRAVLWQIIGEYVDRFRPDLTATAKASLQKDGGNLTFAWAGTTETGTGHYYRVQSPQFLFEYDNTQNNARHPHAVWRDFNGDFGADLLKEHYQKNHTAK